MSIIKIKVQDRSNPDKTIELSRYAVDPKEEPTAVLFGSFVPFTGPKGHGRMLEFAKKHGIKKFAIVSPTKDDTKETDRNMFNLKQKLDIAKHGAKDMGFNVDAFNVKATNPLGMFREIASKIDRPVIIVGPDRKAQFEKFFIPFDKRNKPITDQENKNFGKGEMLAMTDRGTSNTSGTKVRESLRNNDKETFIELTGYTEKMYNYLKKMLNESVTESDCNYIIEATHYMFE